MIILLNGAPRVGKDTAAKFIKKHFSGFTEVKFSAPLKRAVPHLFHIPASKLKDLEETKDEPNPELYGKTYREVQIAISEVLMKPMFNNDAIFGYIMAKQIDNLAGPHFVVSDAGFQREIEPLISIYGMANVALIRITRPDHDFSNDSRGHVEPYEDMKYQEIFNQFDLEMYEQQVIRAMNKLGF